jgi:O-antigen ligase
MSLGLSAKSINGFVVPSTSHEVRIIPIGLPILASAAVLFATAMAATLAIGFRDPRVEYAYECVIFVLAAGWCFAVRETGMTWMPGLQLAAILACGLLQLALGATVYRYATLQGSLRTAALAATAWISCRAFQSRRLRVEFLRAFVWFGMLVAVTSVLAYFTSPGKILWTFDAPYPDIWGPFLSRNNFAQFLELAMPVALWFALREAAGDLLYLSFGAVMLASGLASASRAGSAILVLEAIAVLWICRESRQVRRMALVLLLATVLLAAIPGVANLAGRLTAPDPYQGRREIAHSTLAMIASRPWTGFGLGTFPTVYPAYAVFDAGQSVEHAHNDWLEWAAEGGIPYASIWMVLALWSVRPAARSVWGIGVLGCFLHATVDYPFARFGISAWIFLLLGMLAAATDLREVRHRLH